jgi:glycerophosphoryl diester phosphodiesterase
MRLSQLEVEVAGLHWGLATAQLLPKLKVVAGYREVHVWTANTAAMMTAALEAGADAVVTSHPRKFLRALSARRKACEEHRRLAS